MGSNEVENFLLLKSKLKSEFFFEVPVYGSPITILLGPKAKKAIQKAAELTGFHSDNKNSQVQVKFGQNSLDKEMIENKLSLADVNELRI